MEFSFNQCSLGREPPDPSIGFDRTWYQVTWQANGRREQSDSASITSTPEEPRDPNEDQDQRPPLMEQGAKPRQVSKIGSEQQTADNDQDDCAEMGSKSQD